MFFQLVQIELVASKSPFTCGEKSLLAIALGKSYLENSSDTPDRLPILNRDDAPTCDRLILTVSK